MARDAHERGGLGGAWRMVRLQLGEGTGAFGGWAEGGAKVRLELFHGGRVCLIHTECQRWTLGPRYTVLGIREPGTQLSRLYEASLSRV